MALSTEAIRNYSQRLFGSRLRILNKQPFYGLLLMHAKLGLDEKTETAYTDGDAIRFSPSFMDELSDSELDFVLMHEIMHIVLKHCFRGRNLNHELFNIACDIVVNSNILESNNGKLSSITLSKYGVAMHLAPDEKEGTLYTAEEVYKMFTTIPMGTVSSSGGKGGSSGNEDSFDDHGQWNKMDEKKASELSEAWDNHLINACEAITSRREGGGAGNIPCFAECIWKSMKNPQVDWRTILNNFLDSDINDYSFSPPDHRFSDSDFFLPDYNVYDVKPGKVLFMVDTSGSISDAMLNAAFSEIKGAIEQYDGKLEGYLGFFDAAITPAKPFVEVEDIKKIHPIGGGGTDFIEVFAYIQKEFANDELSYVVILTDGVAIYPEKNPIPQIPLLWVLNNEIITPPFGKVARIQV